jgi:hypothetical protein
VSPTDAELNPDSRLQLAHVLFNIVGDFTLIINQQSELVRTLKSESQIR